MTLFQVTHGLNREGQETVIQQARSTHVGMAHFAHSGPPGKTCRERVSWMKTGQWQATTGKHHGAPKPASCAKYHALMRERGKPVPHNAAACKFFDPADKPQPLQRPARTWE